MQTEIYSNLRHPNVYIGVGLREAAGKLGSINHALEDKIRIIKQTVCEATRVKFEECDKKTRVRDLVMTRQLIFLWLRKKTTLSFKLISREFFIRPDHSTVIHGIQQINNLIETDERVSLINSTIEAELKSLGI